MLWSYENTFCVKKTKITTSFNNFFSSMSVFATHLLEYYDACVWCYWRRSQHSEPGCTAPGLQAENDFDREDYKQKMILTERMTLQILHKKYSRSFTKWQMNHWCHMDYFNNVLTTFLGLELVSCVAVYGGSDSSRISSKIFCFVFRRWR